MTWSQWQVLRVVGLASLMLIGVALVLGVGYYVPQRPAIALLAALFVCLFGLTLMDSAIVPLLMIAPGARQHAHCGRRSRPQPF